MQTWSDSIIHGYFRVRFFLDTNLLIYLVDNKYPSLNNFIELLNEAYKPFVELVSSKYVIFEFVGVRKREHYQRIVIKNLSKTSEGIDILIDSFQNFRDKDKYYLHSEEFDDIKFDNIISNIKTIVEAEVEKIVTDFNISYEYGSFHVDQLDPTFDICLTSKISNYDSLVIVSSVLPQTEPISHNIVFLTADTNLVSFCDPNKIKSALSKHSILPPDVHFIGNLQIAKGGATNLKAENNKSALQHAIRETLLELMKKQLSKYYLGITVEPKNPKIPTDIVFIKLVESYPLVEKIASIKAAPQKKLYVTVISKDLDFIYTTKKDVETFWHNNNQISADYTLPPNKKDVVVSFLVRDIDDERNERPVEQTVLDSIRAKDNLVFIHPDSFV